MQNLVELATTSLTKKSKSIKWLGLAVYTSGSGVWDQTEDQS